MKSIRLSVRLVLLTGCTPMAEHRSPAPLGPSPGAGANTMMHPAETRPPVVFTIPQIPRPAPRSHSYQPRITCSVSPSGNTRVTTSLSVTGDVRNVNDVTTPKLPPPPPRSPQNRSAWSSGDAVITSPLGNTIDAD